MSIEIKVGRHTYEITKKDKFMDNGAVVQLLTQSKENLTWGRRADPVLSKKLVKQLHQDYKKINVRSCDVYSVEYFSFDV